MLTTYTTMRIFFIRFQGHLYLSISLQDRILHILLKSEEKPFKNKSRMGTHPAKIQANENTNTHNLKKKQKQTINKYTLCKED
jgi:hypothetical protein